MRKQSGFTLVEISIVLVIIGLLLGGVLKGQELINSARVKNFATDFRNIPVLVYAYQDKFRALPGDDTGAIAHLGSAATQIPPGSTGNGVLNGNWYDDASLLATSETVAFWEHVRLANLAAGPLPIVSNADLPRNANTGRIGIESGSSTNAYISGMSGSFVVCSANILGQFAKQLDVMMDDGNPYTGSLRAVPGSPTTRNNIPHCAVVGTPSACSQAVDDGGNYTVCMSF
ncbi:MAG: prepilin-type N-terminal cleavage/methylation domain-containing protein [Candidatus Accumulibacter sp.]|jgi:prepilin-type N-terminal cleavage/methylation domain-containing protein|nr:prepilin-type N-terminal cleavage/methylation domain-containing protein [Accumulibacter sp.]